MGRAMLIITAGALVAMGYLSVGASEKGKQLTRTNAGYANQINAKNAAHTAIQIAMNEINKDTTWYDNHYSESTAWTPTIKDADIMLYVEEMSKTASHDDPFDIVTLRMISEATYMDYQAEVISVYEKSRLHFVPEFQSAISFATNNFNFNMGGSPSINGNAPSGSSCEDKPGVMTLNSSDSTDVAEEGGDITGSPEDVTVDSTLSYQPIDKLIARLEDLSSTKHLSGTYKGEMGDSTDPGIFFVDDPVKLSGGLEDGYGIMVIRSDGEVDDSELDVSGNFTFHGLVIFENAWNFDGSGTPAIDGSILVGNTENTSELTVDLTGTIDFQYNCLGEKYAKMASANALKQNRYKRMTTYEGFKQATN